MAEKLYLCDVSFIATAKIPIEADSEAEAAKLAEKRLEQIAILHGLDPRLAQNVRYAADPACDPECDVELLEIKPESLRQCANCDEWFYGNAEVEGDVCCCHQLPKERQPMRRWLQTVRPLTTAKTVLL